MLVVNMRIMLFGVNLGELVRDMVSSIGAGLLLLMVD